MVDWANLKASLAENVKGSNAAKPILEKAKQEAAKLGTKATERFWECLKEEAERHLPQVSNKLEPMTDKECRSFGDEEMEFGQHKGKLMDDVPLDYLAWLADQQTRFSRQLRRYLLSRRIKQETRQ